MDKDNDSKIDCFKCVHYFNTWQPGAPRACRLFGFKSRQLPSEVVFESSGIRCAEFTEKKGGAPGRKTGGISR